MADLNIKILGLLTRFLQAVLFAVGILVFTVLILTGTEGGVSWLVKRVVPVAGEQAGLDIQVSEISGTFLMGCFYEMSLLIGGRKPVELLPGY